MMKKSLTAVSGLGLILFTLNAQAGDYRTNHNSLGVGVITEEVQNEGGSDPSFSGISGNYTHNYNDNFASQVTVGYLHEDDHGYGGESVDIGMFQADVSLLAGFNMVSPGFKGYVGAGVYVEELYDTSGNVPFSETVTGLKGTVGAGYNWDRVSLDLQVHAKNSNDYEDFINDDNSIEALSSSLTLSRRF